MQFTGFFVCSQSCKIITTNFRTCSSPPKILTPVSIYPSLSLFPSPVPGSHQASFCCYRFAYCGHFSESYSIMPPFVSSFFHLAYRFSSSSMVNILPFMAKCSIVWIYCILFIHSSADGHLAYFHSLPLKVMLL